MGYFGTYSSKRQLIHDLTSDSSVLKYCIRGNLLWTVLKHHDTVFIGLNILRKDPDGWYYKPLSEDMAPYYYSCPRGYLRLCTPPTNDLSAGWREAVRSYWYNHP